MDLRELFQAAYGNTSWGYGDNRTNPGMFPVGQGPAPQPDYSMNEPSMVSVNPLERSRNELLDLLANAPGFQAPQAPVQPAFRTPDAIGLLLSGLLEGKRGIVDYSKTLLAGKQQKAAQETQNRDRQTEFQNQRSAQEYQGKLNVAKTKLDFTQQDINRADAQQIRSENQARQARMDDEAAISKFAKAFDTAKSKTAMLQAAKQWRAYEQMRGLDPTGPTDEDAENAWTERAGLERDRIIDNWRNTIANATKDNYGRVHPSSVKGLEARKKADEAMLKRFGDPEPMLDPIPTEETARGLHMSTMLKLAQDRGVILRENADRALVESKAKLIRMREQADMDQKRLELGWFNANRQSEMARKNYELRKEALKYNNQAENRIKGLKAQIQGKEDKLKAESSPFKKKQIASEIAELKGRVKFWREQMETPDTPTGQTSPPGGKAAVEWKASDGTTVRWNP